MADEKDEQAGSSPESNTSGREVGAETGAAETAVNSGAPGEETVLPIPSGEEVVNETPKANESTEELASGGTEEAAAPESGGEAPAATEPGSAPAEGGSGVPSGGENLLDGSQNEGGDGQVRQEDDGEGDGVTLSKAPDPATVNLDYATQLSYQAKLLAANKGTRVLRVAIRDYEVLNIHGLMNGPTGVLKDSDVTLIASEEIRPGVYSILE